MDILADLVALREEIRRRYSDPPTGWVAEQIDAIIRKARENAEQTAWLIERVNVPRPTYWNGSDFAAGWTEDVSQAVRFARRIDAIRAYERAPFPPSGAKFAGSELAFIEHAWIPTPEEAPGEPQPSGDTNQDDEAKPWALVDYPGSPAHSPVTVAPAPGGEQAGLSGLWCMTCGYHRGEFPNGRYDCPHGHGKLTQATLLPSRPASGLREAAEEVSAAWFDGRKDGEPVRDPARLDKAMDALNDALARRYGAEPGEARFVCEVCGQTWTLPPRDHPSRGEAFFALCKDAFVHKTPGGENCIGHIT